MRDLLRQRAAEDGRAWALRRWLAKPDLRKDAPPFVLDGPAYTYGASPEYWREVCWEAREHWRRLQGDLVQVENE